MNISISHFGLPLEFMEIFPKSSILFIIQLSTACLPEQIANPLVTTQESIHTQRAGHLYLVLLSLLRTQSII